ncbi:non-ribosomal peptide synthetase [Lysobacter enzymogenes]|uniref:non-ribosomal peptide synthetase n=1 Tax=Lysobacter enzymogenes TaxID=69 RepID=UPI001F60BFB7|nr:non-ribosomal peptide synthetase [Lysobacter enzymogenes]
MLGQGGAADYRDEDIVADPALLLSPQATSFAQRRIWLESTLSDDKAIYNTRVAGRIRGELSLDALEAAFTAIVARHAILRTVYLADEGEPLQKVLPAAQVRVSLSDHRGLDADAQAAALRALVDREMLHPFDLGRDPPLRVHLLEFADDHHELVITIHHIATDGWSTGVLLRELDALYGARLRGEPDPLPDLPIQYVDYAVWQRARLSGRSLETLLDYWRERLDGVAAVHGLPLDFERPQRQGHAGGVHLQRLDAASAAGLAALSSSLNTSAFVVLQSLFALLISRYSGNHDVLMGSANASRVEAAVQPLLGCFLNNLVLRADLSVDQPVSRFLCDQQRRFIADFEHQHVPFELLVEQVNPERSLAHHPLVQIMFTYENGSTSDGETGALGLQRHELEYDVSKFDLSLHAGPVGDGIEIAWGYSVELFKPETIARMAAGLRSLLAGVLADPERKLSSLALTDDGALAELAVLAQGPALEREAVLVPALIERHAAGRGDKVALSLEDETLSFAELDARANQIARLLAVSGVQAGDRVGVCQERSLDMLASVIGTMKAGAVYVPLDPGYPDERLAYLLSDAGIGHVLTEAYLAPQLPLNGQRVVLVSDADEQDATAFASPVTGESPAYMIYTSGSTGQPKGVVVSHGALADKLAALAQNYDLDETDRSLLFASTSFDASISQLLTTLSVGGSVALRPDGVTEPEALLAYVAAQGVTWMHVVPAYLRQLLEVPGWSDTKLRRVSSGGDVLDRGLQQAWFVPERSGIALYNSYGPTEITITSSVHRVRGDEAVVPIGRPLANTRYWVLDEQGRALPRGAVGELCIGGSSLADGYWGRDQQTHERFVELEPIPGQRERLYRSGDRARWNELGELEFVGRNDHQVKVRGYRIELGEIETALQACDGVTGAVVKVEQDSLWAYVSLSSSDLARVEADLSSRLPGYLLPGGYEQVDEWPLTRSGKIDRRALVRGQAAAPKRREPGNETESALLEIWSALLKTDDIGVTENFFQRGGHSLLATRLASQIRRRFEVDFTLKSLFELPSIEEQAGLILAQKANSATQEATVQAPHLPAIVPLSTDEPVELSYAQSRLWILSELENASSAYNSPQTIAIDGELDAAALERAIGALVERHTILRTVIRQGESGPVQSILPAPVFRLTREDVSGLAEREQDEAIAAIARDSAAAPFDLSQDLMLRGCLVRCAAERHVLVLTLHHIVCDGWSMAVLTRELNALYAVAAENGVDVRAPLSIQYRDYAHWQRQWLQGPALDETRDYWLRRLSGLPQVHQLPLDRPRPVQPSYRGAVHRQELPADLKQALESLSQRQRTTLFMTVQSAFAVLLSRFSGEGDIVVGTAIANREQPELAELIGLFANTLVLRTQVAAEQPFVELLERSRQQLLADFAHQHMPFELLVEALNPARQLSHNPLFQIMLLWQNNERAALDLGEGLQFSDYPLERAVSKFDLTLTVQEADDGGLWLSWRYASDLFDEISVRAWADSFACLLEGVAADPGQRVGKLPAMNEDARKTVLGWHRRDAGAAPAPACLHQNFERQAAATPDAIALASGDRSWTYASLNARANAVARRLREQGAGIGSVVGVCAERHGDLVAALLGTLKAGAAYLPLDPAYPAERLQYMVNDSGARWLVGDRACLDAWSDSDIALLTLETVETAAADAQNFDAGATPADLAYVIYTSGSTGRPKGVTIGHAAATQFLASAHEALATGDDVPYRWLAVTPVSFDISVLELFLPLSQGGTVILADRAATQDGNALAALIDTQAITALQATPVTWKLLREVGWQGHAGLKALVGGELVAESLGHWLASLSAGAWNCYGPTEATVWTHMKPFARDGRLTGTVSDLGGRLRHVDQQVVGLDGEPAPIGGVGELWLGGQALAAGYWNRDELTAERFVDRDLLDGPRRWYRTGDWVQLRHDGELRYLGRIDQQIKLRGHRIELGEIEQCLHGLSDIADAVVDVYRPGDGREPQLAAYVVLQAGANAPAEDAWRSHLAAHLPDYMHPASLTVLDALPLSANGKIDRKALPAPQLGAADEHAEATSDNERLLADLWSQLLGLENVSVAANFFQLGGHSLLAARLINRLAEQGISLELKQIFLHPTIRALAAQLGQASAQPVAPPLPVRSPETARRGAVRTLASFAQTRLWFLERLRPVPGAYHINTLLKLDEALDLAAFNAAISQLVQRHAALRTRFEYSDDTLYQVVRPALAPMVALFDLSSVAGPELAPRLRALCDEQKYRAIDLTRDSPLQLSVIKAGAEQWYVFLTFHHIVSDGWSVDLFVRELQHLYVCHRDGVEDSLAEPESGYQDYSDWQRDWLQGEPLKQLMTYWTQRLDGAPSEHRLPLDRPRPALPSFDGAIHREILDAATTARFKSFLSGQDASLFVGLKALFCALLARYSGEKDIVIGTAVANRPHRALEQVVGFFANTLVMRQRMRERQDFRSLLREARDAFLADHEHQQLPFELLVDALKPERKLAANPLFQIMLVLQNLESPTSGADAEADGFVAQDQDRGSSQFDLTLAVREHEGTLVFAWRYATELFDGERIAELAGALLRLIGQALTDPDGDVHALPILSETEIARQTSDCNRTGRTFADGERRVHELVERWAASTPEATAVVAGAARLSYGELDRRADSVAAQLRAAGVGAGERVGLLIAPSLESAVAMLAVLKAGGAYVPLDPSYPPDRLRHMAAEAGIAHLLIRRGNAGVASAWSDTDEWIAIEVDATAPFEPAPPVPVVADAVSSEQAPAYAIYTSGSTGRPKGVLLHHRGLVNHVLSQRELFAVGAESRILQYAAMSFDVAACETFLALCSGAELHIVDEPLKTQPLALARYVETAGITHLMLIPSVLALLPPERLRGVRSIIVGGETIRAEQAEAWSRHNRLFNAYGPTEATICAVAEEYLGQGVAIGHPIDNMAAYLLDGNGRVVPQGVPGELYLGGVGLALRYLNQPALTAERFVEHRFETGAVQRLYRTGDLARRRGDGRIEFLGRLDDQVKVRGHRVETDEISACIGELAGVREAVAHALALAGDEKSLVAYVVPAQPLDEDGWARLSAGLHDALAARLPAYMLPSAYVRMARLPTLENGKVDRGALPKPQTLATVAAQAQPPNTATEVALCEALSQVLGREQADVAGNFFQLGGNSILAMKLVARIETVFGVALPLSVLFEARTIRQLAADIDERRGSVAERSRPAIEAAPGSESGAPLSYQQLRIWFLSEMEDRSGAYNASWSLAVDGELDVAALERAFAMLIERHAALRSVVRAGESGPVQSALPAPQFRLLRSDVSGLSGNAQDQAIAAIAHDSAGTPFDLSQDLMLRGCLVRRAADRHVLVLTLHHIACDGWSKAVLTRELNALYAAAAIGGGDTRAPLPIQYRDYAQWQRQWLQGPALEEARDYWLQRLGGLPQVHQLPLDRPRPVQPSYRGALYRQELPAKLKQALESLSQRQRTTLFMTVQSAFAVLLSRFSGEGDIVVGTAIANREQPELAELIGLFANTLVLRTQVAAEQPFVELLERSRQQLLADFAHQHMPFELLVEALNPARQLSHNPLFQIMLLWQNNERAALDLGEGLRFSDYPLERAVSKFDLTLTVQEADDGGLWLSWRYASDLFDEVSVRAWANSFACLLEGIAADPARRVGQLPVMGEDEKNTVLGWHRHDAQHEAIATCVHRNFERQAAQTPDAVALVGGDAAWTYATLNARANAVARRLREQGAGVGSVVGVCAERHADLVAALLGTLKAGAAYLPLDPAYPAERLHYMVGDSGARWLLGDRVCLDAWAEADIVRLPLDAIETVDGDAANTDVGVAPADLAYVIYTSGSTGRPKGVMIGHSAATRFLASAHEALATGDDVPYRWLAVTPVSFDISVLELFLPLSQGGAVVLADRAATQDGNALAALIDTQSITALQATPVTWKLLREVGWQGHAGLKALVGGELVAESLGHWLASVSAGAWNCYGPTEATVWTHMKPFARDGRLTGTVSDLGGRLRHVDQQVVGLDGEPAPIGGVGELWLGGKALAAGYWNRDELTAERFVERDLLDGPRRWYRTGDWVQLRHDGELRYLGRIDQQIKLRGHRIELGEIEQCLHGLSAIADAVVDVYRPGEGREPQLVAYAVLQAGADAPADDAWRSHLAAQLPDYMHPASLTVLDALPLTANGKIDRKALPAPQQTAAAAYVAPANDIERQLAQLWSQLLGVETVSVTANFFQLGGHSLLATRLVAQLAESLHARVPIRAVFEQPTVRGLAEWIEVGRMVAELDHSAARSVSDELVI